MSTVRAWYVLLLTILITLAPLPCFGVLKISVKTTSSSIELLFEQSSVREIELPSQNSYMISCDLAESDDFLANPWIKDSVILPKLDSSNSMVLTQTGAFYVNERLTTNTLYINNFNDTLSGNYTCQSTKDTKSIIITTANPTVLTGFDYIERTIGESDPISGSCRFLSNPHVDLVDFTWLFEGAPLNDDTVVPFFLGKTGFSISVTNGFQKQHSGVYTIVANSTIGTAMENFMLVVFTHPELQFSSDCDCNITGDDKAAIIVNAGDSFTIFCDDTNSNPIPLFTWFRSDTEDEDNVIVPDEYVNTTLVSSQRSNLVFSNIQLSYAGDYSCKANNSKLKDFKTITVNINHPSQVNAISPTTINAPVGNELNILIDYISGYPAPLANWTHYDGLVNRPIIENQRASLHGGVYSLNLTIVDTKVSDGGVYTLSVGNGVGDAVTLEFTVNILVPPSLIHETNYTNYRPVGGMVKFIVKVSTAQPPVTPTDLVWSGNFTEDRQTVTYENGEVVLLINNLIVSDTGNVTLMIKHAAKDVLINFELIVLYVPNNPVSVNIISIGTCHKRVTWEINDPAPLTAHIDELRLEHRACLYNDSSCDKEWEVLAVHSPDVQTCDIILSPNQVCSYSVSSCNDDFGCNENTIIETTVNSNVQGFNPKVTSLIVKPVNSSAIQVSWSEPRKQTDCYTIQYYTITCQNTGQRDSIYTTKVVPNLRTDYDIIFTGLEADSEYNCTGTILYKDPFNITVNIDGLPAYDINYTYPVRLVTPQKENLELDINNEVGEGSASIDLETVKNVFNQQDTSYIQIIVLRLGNSPTVSSQSPDELYPNMNDFSTYELVHSESGRLSYKPYIAAEISIDNIPDTFIIGSDSRKQETYTNGPLDMSDYYSVFIRAYAVSQFGMQTNVFVSSSFTSPFQTEPESGGGTTDAAKSNAGVIAGSVVVVLIIMAIVAAVIVSVIAFYIYRRRGRKQMMPLSQIADTNGVELGMNQYSDLGEVKGRSASPPPELPSTSPPKKKPLMATNPNFDNESSTASSSPFGKEDPDDTASVSIKMPPDSSPSISSRHFETPHPTSPASVAGKKSPSQPILRDEFQNHLDYLDDNGHALFTKEFTSIQAYSREHPSEASNRANMIHGKNRYKNITAFDYTRVVLSEVDDISKSDYINANYIKGYDEHKLYIATQGPTEETHVDFWRMIWEQKTTTIVMLTNLEEKGKPKCFKYWPSQGGKAYGNIVVRVDRDIVLPFYIIRSFKLIDASFSEGERTIIQFHYTAWPDKNVPAQASPLLDFLRAINTANDSAKHGPIVAHCSAGVGRTGTIIGLDICLDQLQTEGRVDVRSVVSFLREQRTQMVQTQSQYIFIHHAILEDIVYGDSTVLLKSYPEKYLKLQASHCALIKEEHDKIGMVRPPAQANPGPSLLKIRTEDGSEAAFPAFVIDGYWYQNLFITCSRPPPDNEEVFWRLVWQEGCSHVINISQKSHGLTSYLPDSGEQKKLGELELTVEKMEYKTGYILRTITIAVEQCKETLSVKHMQFEDWQSNQLLPRTDKFVKFVQECMRETHSIERQEKPMLIHDNGGMAQVGIFMALLNCCERIKKERLVDLLQSVNRLNLQCPEMIASMELNLYAYCYDCLREYCGKLLRETSEPPIYENIASIRGRLQPSPEPVESPKYLNDYDILDETVLASLK